jgi:hypothetical protein
MSAQVQEVEAAVLLQSLGSGHVIACRSDEQGRRLLSVTWRRYRAVGDRELAESVDHDGCRLCSLTIAAHMAYDSGQLRQFLIALEHVVLDLHVSATSADMACYSRPWPSIFLHLSGRNSSRLVDRVRTATQVEVVYSSRARLDGCDSDSERAVCHCETPIGFAGVVRRVCMRAQELAWAIGGYGAHPPCRAFGVGCTSYYYDV